MHVISMVHIRLTELLFAVSFNGVQTDNSED